MNRGSLQKSPVSRLESLLIETAKRLDLTARLHREFPESGWLSAARTAWKIRRFALANKLTDDDAQLVEHSTRLALAQPDESDYFAADVLGDVIALPVTDWGDDR